MKNKIKKIENLENYLHQFSIDSFLCTLSLEPKPWYRGRVGKDDYWGVDLSISQEYDPYFELKRFVFKSKIDFHLWEDSGYTSGYRMMIDLKEGGMNEEWKEAKKREVLLKEYIKENYSLEEHINTLHNINSLNEEELNTLNEIYWYLDYTEENRLMIYKKKGTLINKWRSQLASNIDITGLKSLVNKDIIEFSFTVEHIKDDSIKVYSFEEFKNLEDGII